MPFIKTKCPKCGKTAETTKEYTIGTKIGAVLKCGHLLIKDAISSSAENANGHELTIKDFISIDGKSLFKYQQDGVLFLERSGGRALIADEMGLGKTIQALAFIALHPELQPVSYILKSSLKIQWSHEIVRWCSPSDDEEDLVLSQVIETSQDYMLPGFKHYLFSFDILRRFDDLDKKKKLRNGSLPEQFRKRGIKTVVIDECQQIKNPESQRTQQVRELCKDIPNVIALSGTPIKNNAAEYFPVLNILKPELYPKFSRFIYNECDSYNNGWGTKVGGLRDPKAFLAKTKHFIIRRERKEVMPDLPTVSRNFHFDELGEEVTEAYKLAFMQFRDDYYSGGQSNFAEASNTLAYLSKMRHLTGLSKVKPCTEFIESFLTETDRKIVIFVHHKDVGTILSERIDKAIEDLNSTGAWSIAPTLSLTADIKDIARDQMITKFREDSSCRVMLASTLSSGEGLNLQFCSDCVILERQWNPANEEQAESRFIRIGQLSDKVAATYFVAVGTVDEFFARIVEEKREIVNKTLSGEAVKWDQSQLMKELAEVLAAQGGRMWNL